MSRPRAILAQSSHSSLPTIWFLALFCGLVVMFECFITGLVILGMCTLFSFMCKIVSQQPANNNCCLLLNNCPHIPPYLYK